MSSPLQPEVVQGPPPSQQQIQFQALETDLRFRAKQVVVIAGVSVPLALYGFAGRATWAKTVGVLGLIVTGLAYIDVKRLGQERDYAQKGLVLS